MVKCVPFLRVPDIAQTIEWYERIGFKCIGTNHQWEPDCELNWAELAWEGAAFMIGPGGSGKVFEGKEASLYFTLQSIDGMAQKLKGKGVIVEVHEDTFYGMNEVMFEDLNGFAVTFGCEVKKT